MTRLVVTRRHFGAVGIGGVAAWLGLRNARADGLPAPVNKPLLAVSGAISVTNGAQGAVFDRAMLEGLGTDQITTGTPWSTGKSRFEGVRLSRLMEAVGATGSVVTAYSLNDFTVSIPTSDFAKYGPILAMKRDGEYMPVRDKGPLFILYPYDSDPELRQQTYYHRSAWQVVRLAVE